MRNLSDTDRQALQLAGHLQKAVEQWLSYRGAGQSCAISPFVDSTGQPAVLIKMNARTACAMIESLNEQHTYSGGQSRPGRTPRSRPPGDAARP
ncbi:MAG TPA: hypothetical protein VLW50_23205 [Streptosporangiaceae bacterium]|nr:hypothetical protein [Streptosporangiaceae bacterium]